MNSQTNLASCAVILITNMKYLQLVAKKEVDRPDLHLHSCRRRIFFEEMPTILEHRQQTDKYLYLFNPDSKLEAFLPAFPENNKSWEKLRFCSV